MTADLSTEALTSKIIRLWSELLGVAPEPDDNFFDLGGNSLLVVDFVLMAREHSIDVRSIDVFTHSTPIGLATALADGGPS
jgi:hypothetical protein